MVAIYDLLAPHYDAVTGDSSTETAFIDGVIKDTCPRAVTLLEVACGTGEIIASLATRYQVSGLDISSGMLAVARKKLPAGIPLYVADMSDFKLDMKFDAVICVYHGVNHLLGFSAWESFFDRVHGHLNDGGVFAFDTYAVSNLELMASGPEIVQEFGQNYLNIRVRANGEAVYDWNIEVRELQPDGSYKSFTEVIRIAAFPPEKIQTALSARFANIRITESYGAADDDSGHRIWFTCTKDS
jgi:SAM-dependent methyltransferase